MGQELEVQFIHALPFGLFRVGILYRFHSKLSLTLTFKIKNYG